MARDPEVLILSCPKCGERYTHLSTVEEENLPNNDPGHDNRPGAIIGFSCESCGVIAFVLEIFNHKGYTCFRALDPDTGLPLELIIGSLDDEVDWPVTVDPDHTRERLNRESFVSARQAAAVQALEFERSIAELHEPDA